jgi:hypothetical protein
VSDVSALGIVVAGLSPDELASLQVAAFGGVTPAAVTHLIPVSILRFPIFGLAVQNKYSTRTNIFTKQWPKFTQKICM